MAETILRTRTGLNFSSQLTNLKIHTTRTRDLELQSPVKGSELRNSIRGSIQYHIIVMACIFEVIAFITRFLIQVCCLTNGFH